MYTIFYSNFIVWLVKIYKYLSKVRGSKPLVFFYFKIKLVSKLEKILNKLEISAFFEFKFSIFEIKSTKTVKGNLTIGEFE